MRAARFRISNIIPNVKILRITHLRGRCSAQHSEEGGIQVLAG